MKSIKRVLVKLSGEALLAADGYWLDPKTLSTLAADLAGASRHGYQIAVVIGGGNIIRGAKVGAAGWIDRATADSMGMLATIVNSIALESALVAAGENFVGCSHAYDLRDLCAATSSPSYREGTNYCSGWRYGEPIFYNRHCSSSQVYRTQM